MKRIAFSLLSVVMLIVMALPAASTAVLAGEGGIVNLTTSSEPAHIVISPDNATIKGDGEETQAYTAEAFDAQGNSLGDVTQDTEFTIQPEAGGSWDGNEYTSLYGGTWEVTGSYTDGNVTLTDTATLYVIESRAHQESKAASPDLSTRDSEPDTTIEPRRVDQANPPYLNVTKSVSPDLICIDDTATVTLNITGAGNASVERVPLDVMLIIDRSGSMGWDSPSKLSKAKDAAKTFVGNLNSSLDRVGLVSFASTATLNRNLTNNFTAVNASITAMSASGATCIGCGINLTNQEFLPPPPVGRPDAVWVEILLTDGSPNKPNGPGNGFNEADAQYARNLTQAARNANITLYTIGLGSDVNQSFLDDKPAINHTSYAHDGLAYVGGGKYYFAPTPADLQTIFSELAYEVTHIAGRDIVVTEILDAGVNCTIWGTNTTWNISSISINHSWEQSFNVTFDEAGYQLVDAENAHINYTDYLGNPASQLLPPRYITVIAKPIANFSANNTNPCVNTPILFTDSSTGNPTSWTWDFPGGTPSNATGVGPHTVTYSAAGNYTVNLTVSNTCGSDTETKTNYITVKPAPQANFSANNTNPCVNTPILFTDSSTGNPTSWTWDFPGGTPSNATGVGPHTVTYSAAGNYTVNLTVSNTCGSDTETKTNYITVKAAPVADFSANVTNPCVNASVNFTDLSTPIGEILTWSWDFGDGSNSTAQNPTHQYSSAGNYTVNLTVSNACGSDTETKTDYITVKAAPVADFSANVTNPCVNASVNFTDLSTPIGEILTWSWDFGDGSNSTDQNPTHQYSSAGNYTVNLTVSNACGSDTETKTNYITVKAAPVADFSANVTNPCVNASVNFTDLSTPIGEILTWSWDFGDGSNSTDQNPTHQYSSAGNYTVNLTVSNACGSDTETKTNYITVKAAPVADFSANVTNPCVNASVNFTDLSTPIGEILTWSWDFGDGSNSTDQNPTHQYSSAGNYTVNLTVSNACGSDTKTKTDYITVKAAPVADFSANVTNPCVNASVNFTDLSTPIGEILTWSWDFGDGSNSTDQNPTHQYSSAGNYTVNLTVSNACGSDTETKTNYITVKAAPVADFSANVTNPCVNASVNFTDLSTPIGEILTWSWDFGDGSNSTDQNPTHQYSSAGNYTVNLTVSNACGSDTETKTNYITVKAAPVADFSANVTNPCVNASVNFTDLSTPIGEILTWSWDFGDGSNSTDQNPTHQYSSAGNYTVNLTVSNACGSDTETKTNYITVKAAPVADFSAAPNNTCVNTTVNFTDLSTPIGEILTWSWDFGDGSNSTDQNPTHQYSSAGNYTVNLTVSNACGSDTKTKTDYITVKAAPVADFSANVTNPCVNASVNFTDLSTPIGEILTWSWDFGDGSNSTDQNPTHQYSSAGNYTVNLTVSNACGSDTETKTDYITVKAAPVADFSANVTNPCVNASVNFTDLSTPIGEILTWSWDFGDGSNSTDQNPTHQYSSAGNYTVNLTVSNACGSDTETKTNYITVKAAPVADFSANVTNPCVNASVNFTDLSTPIGEILTWSWDFGDGSNSTDQNPTHQYSSAGNYTVNLTVSNACGSDTETKTNYITVKAAPVADFSANVTNPCVNASVNFTDLSTPIGEILTWSWDFGDGSNSTDQNPTHQYSSAGNYTVNLTVSNACGSDTKTKTDYITVKAAPVADFSANVTNPCVNASVNFTDLSTPIGEILTWSWDFGDGSNSTDQNPTHQYSSAGNYTVNLTVSNACGSDTETKTNYITVKAAPVADFSANVTNPCVNASVNFTDLSTPIGEILTWSWDFGDGSNSTDQNPTHQYSSAGNYTVNLTVSNACGSDTETKTDYITVKAAPVADFSASDQNPCVNTDVNFTDLSTPADNIDSWNWDFGDGSNSTDQNPSHQYSSAGNYTVSLTVSNECGNDTETKTNYITVKAAPQADFSASDQNPCVNTDVNFTDLSTPADNIDSWNWDFGDGSNSTDQNPSHQYSSAGNYTVSLTVSNECGNDTETKTNYITVKAAPQADFSASDQNPCVNTDVNFTDLSTPADNIDSWSWDFGDGSNSTDQNPSHQYSSAGNYTVSLTVSNECGNDTETKTNYITVKAAPQADFSASDQNPCVNTDVNFTDLSTPADNIDSWSWDFGDGSNSTDQNPSHQYSSAGNYTVSLTVSNECGNDTETKTNYITVKAAPQADFSASDQNPCVNTDVNFTDLSTPTGEILTWSWDFGDGSNSTDQNPSHQYSSAGNYTVSLTVTNECGNDTKTETNYITVKAPPVAAFTATPPSGDAPLTVNFTDLSTGTIDNWTWDFPGGSPSNATGQGPQTVTYSAVGTYTVNLTVSNACGSNTATATVTVTTYTPTPGGGGGGGGGTCYLDIDMLGKITRVRISCATSRTLESKVAPDFNNTNFLEIDLGTRVLCDDLGTRPEALVMRLANETPPVPDGSALVSPVYNFTGNYTSISCGNHNALQCCSGVTFDQNITIVLNYDPDELPEFIASLAVAYYDTEQGIWVGLSPDIGRVAEIGKATGLINHFSTVAIIAELAPPPAPASFVASTLNIEQSPLVWKNIFVGVTGEDVTITANVANNGGQEGTYTAELKLNGKTVDTKEVTLAAGQSQQVSFTVSGMDYGQYKVEVAGLSGEFTVSRSIKWWLIIGIILAVGLITWAAIWWRKRRKPGVVRLFY